MYKHIYVCMYRLAVYNKLILEGFLPNNNFVLFPVYSTPYRYILRVCLRQTKACNTGMKLPVFTGITKYWLTYHLAPRKLDMKSFIAISASNYREGKNQGTSKIAKKAWSHVIKISRHVPYDLLPVLSNWVYFNKVQLSQMKENHWTKKREYIWARIIPSACKRIKCN